MPPAIICDGISGISREWRLISYGAALRMRSVDADYVGRILKGENPADCRRAADEIRAGINLKTATALA